MDVDTLLLTVFVVSGVAHLVAVLLIAADLYRGTTVRSVAWITDPPAAFAVATVIGWSVGLDARGVGAVAVIGVAVTVVVARRAADFRPAGVVAWATLLAGTLTGTAVAFVQLADLALGPVALVLLWTVAVVGVLRTPSSVMQTFENWEAGLRWRWHRSREPRTDWEPPADAPMVTVQVPIHAEPAEIVIATLDALARLDYPNHEVLVIDNNTHNEELWRPVEEHCVRLGPRFRFLHVEGITGAKAGALNWSREYLDPRTRLVALVDADYLADPAWLKHTVGLFDDPTLGFVQCPHAYRDYAHSAYGRWANTAYEWAQHTEMPSRNEQNAGITVGTMSLIRLETLDLAGGWAEWCQTEDSEFAIRAHAAGYGSILVNRAYGWGLIPETLAELKKQRYRWTYGPGQEFKRHLRLYLTRRSGLTGAQRLRHGHYGLVILTTGLGVLSLPISLALLVSMFVRQDTPEIEPLVLLPFIAFLAGRRMMRWVLFHKVVGATPRQILGGFVALLAVKPTMSTAAFNVLIGRPAVWQRTTKFRALPSTYRWVVDSGPEIAFAIGCLLAAVAAATALPTGIASALLVAGFAWQALVYATAPLLAVAAERALTSSSLPPDPASGPDPVEPGLDPTFR
jgi:glycosyl transferase family 2